MNVVKKIISLRYNKKGFLPLQMLRNPKKMFVFLPMESYELDSLMPALQLLRHNFLNTFITGITKTKDSSFFQKTRVFNQIISYESKPFFLSRQFFRLKKKLREKPASISIDFNLKSDILSWLGGASLRIGVMNSAFINYKVKLKNVRSSEIPLRLVKAICIDH
jgi:hypothetical protein